MVAVIGLCECCGWNWSRTATLQNCNSLKEPLIYIVWWTHSSPALSWALIFFIKVALSGNQIPHYTHLTVFSVIFKCNITQWVVDCVRFDYSSNETYDYICALSYPWSINTKRLSRCFFCLFLLQSLDLSSHLTVSLQKQLKTQNRRHAIENAESSLPRGTWSPEQRWCQPRNRQSWSRKVSASFRQLFPLRLHRLGQHSGCGPKEGVKRGSDLTWLYIMHHV